MDMFLIASNLFASDCRFMLPLCICFFLLFWFVYRRLWHEVCCFSFVDCFDFSIRLGFVYYIGSGSAAKYCQRCHAVLPRFCCRFDWFCFMITALTCLICSRFHCLFVSQCRSEAVCSRFCICLWLLSVTSLLCFVLVFIFIVCWLAQTRNLFAQVVYMYIWLNESDLCAFSFHCLWVAVDANVWTCRMSAQILYLFMIIDSDLFASFLFSCSIVCKLVRSRSLFGQVLRPTFDCQLRRRVVLLHFVSALIWARQCQVCSLWSCFCPWLFVMMQGLSRDLAKASI